MPPTTVNTMPRHTSVLNTSSLASTEAISLREFVVDEDAENFNAALWRTIDQNAFILAQRDALEAFNVAKALRLSKETAAAELERRKVATVIPRPAESQSTSSSSRHQHHGSQPIEIKKGGATPPQHATLSDEAIARSLARSWQVDASQHTLPENRSSPSSSTSPTKPTKFSPPSSSPHQQDKKAPGPIAKQHSRNQLSLSTSSFPTSSSPSTAVDSRHSRSTSQSNTFTKVPSLSLPPIGDQRTLSKTEPLATDDPTGSIPSTSQFQTSDAMHSKRRHTERKPSVSSPSLDVPVVAPPLSEPQKSSTFSRNLRPGTVIPPAKDNSPSSVSKSEGSKSQSVAPPPKPTPVPKQKAYLNNPFSDVHKCPQCGNRLTMPRVQQLSTPLNSRSLCDALHTTCSSCMTRHCRGCTSVSPCKRPCSAGQNTTTCAVRNCCYNVRAVVIFEALNIFDHIFATEAGFATTTSIDGVDPTSADPHHTFHSERQQREAYIKLLISKADKSMRKFEDAFVRTLRIICSWLQLSPEVDFDADDEKSPAFGNPSFLNDSIPHLLLASYLPEVIHTFLSNNNVRDWMAHSETYSMILETLRWISDSPTLTHVLNQPLPPVQRNCTLKQWATGQGVISFLRYQSQVVEGEPIGDLIKKLEMHRMGLRAFATKVQFEATLDKVNMLCDGITYLLLQQVVGSF